MHVTDTARIRTQCVPDLEKSDFVVVVVISRRIYVQTASFLIIFDTVTDMILLHIYEAAPNAAERPANAATDNMDSFSFADGMEVDFSEEFEITEEDEKLFHDFNDFIKNFNDYICKQWEEKVQTEQKNPSAADVETVEDFIDIDVDK